MTISRIISLKPTNKINKPVIGSEGSMTEQEEELNFDAVTAKVSANPTGSSGARMTLQSCPELS